MSKKHFRYVKCRILVLAVFSFLLVPVFVSGQTNTSADALIIKLQEQIKALQEQVTKLQAEVFTTKTELEAVKTELKFTKALRLGVRGDEVKQLQEFLKSFPDIYPQGLVTGYFGPLTEAAVRKFQEKQGIESIGVVGPKTLSKLNELITEGTGASGVIPPGLLIAPGIQKKLEATTTAPAQPISTSTISIATTTPSGTIPAVSATPATPAIPTSISGTPTAPATPATPATPAQPATTATSTTPTTADITPPVISNVRAESIASSSVQIKYTTDEPASNLKLDMVFWNTDNSSLFPRGEFAHCLPETSIVTDHCIYIVNLSPNTTYYYKAQATDLSNNLGSSGVFQFTTSSGTSNNSTSSDTTPPSVPTGLTATIYNFSTSQITVSWNSSTDNIGVAGYKIYRNGTFITNYTNTSYTSFSTYYNGENLAAGTTYSFTIAAYDAAGNVSEQSSPISARTYEAPTMIFPNGGETLKVSSSSNLKWYSTTAGQKVSMYIFKAGDLNNFLQAAFNVTANNAGENSIPWTVSTYGLSLTGIATSFAYKDLGAGQYYTRVCPSEILDQSMANGFNCDDSNALFTIESQSTTTTSSLNTRVKNLATISLMLNSLSEILEKLSQLMK